MNADGSVRTNLTNTPGPEEQHVNFSPDGRRIVFARFSGPDADIAAVDPMAPGPFRSPRYRHQSKPARASPPTGGGSLAAAVTGDHDLWAPDATAPTRAPQLSRFSSDRHRTPPSPPTGSGSPSGGHRHRAEPRRSGEVPLHAHPRHRQSGREGRCWAPEEEDPVPALQRHAGEIRVMNADGSAELHRRTRPRPSPRHPLTGNPCTGVRGGARPWSARSARSSRAPSDPSDRRPRGNDKPVGRGGKDRSAAAGATTSSRAAPATTGIRRSRARQARWKGARVRRGRRQGHGTAWRRRRSSWANE